VSQALTLGTALLLGLIASGHCLLMCGGITAALGLATARNASGRPRAELLLAYQFGRIASYALAGLLLGGLLGNVIALLDAEAVRHGLRIMTALVLVLAALVTLGKLRDPGTRMGRLLWPYVARLGRTLLPVKNLRGALGFGMIWGWMPCGLAYTVLLIAVLQGDALRSAALMAAFGLGTLPALFAASFGAQELMGWSHGAAAKYATSGILLVSATVTLAGPWLIAAAPGLHGWLPFDCSSTR
jgi:sulfite exporter TauE/SafE